MSDQYLKVGTSGRVYLYYQNPTTGAPVTGVVAGSFTLQITKEGTGNQATTGCTGPTEVDATNNAGVYSIAVSGSTGFLAATGTYQFKVFLTADNTLVWNGTVRVTSDGTGAGTYGAASFTAVASNGRVMSGGVPLAAATVRILTPAGALYVETTSDASGLWGPVYFNTNGTYAVYVQKTGYTITSGTIIVSGSTATGPGADLTITATSTGSTVLVSTLMAYCRRVMLDSSGSESDVLALEIINEAAETIFMESQNPYWNKVGVIELMAAYTTGTLTLTNASAAVTFTGTLPSWVDAGSDLFITSLGTWYRVLTRDSNTQVTLTDSYNGTTTASLAFSLAKTRYVLPSTCARTNDLLFGAQWPYSPTMISAARLEMMKDQWQATGSAPAVTAIEKDYLCVWPPPNEYRRCNFMYFGKPAQVTSGSDTLDFPADQVLLLRRAIDYCASLRGATTAETRALAKKEYDTALSKALAWDKTTTNITPETMPGWATNNTGPSWLGSVSDAP